MSWNFNYHGWLEGSYTTKDQRASKKNPPMAKLTSPNLKVNTMISYNPEFGQDEITIVISKKQGDDYVDVKSFSFKESEL